MRVDRIEAAPGLKTAVAVTGLLAAVTFGGLLLFTVGEGAAIFMGGSVVVGAVLTAALAGQNVARAVLAAVSLTLVHVGTHWRIRCSASCRRAHGWRRRPTGSPTRPRPAESGQRQDRRRNGHACLPARTRRTRAQRRAPGCARRGGQSLPARDRGHHEPRRRSGPAGIRRRSSRKVASTSWEHSRPSSSRAAST